MSVNAQFITSHGSTRPAKKDIVLRKELIAAQFSFVKLVILFAPGRGQEENKEGKADITREQNRRGGISRPCFHDPEDVFDIGAPKLRSPRQELGKKSG